MEEETKQTEEIFNDDPYPVLSNGKYDFEIINVEETIAKVSGNPCLSVSVSEIKSGMRVKRTVSKRIWLYTQLIFACGRFRQLKKGDKLKIPQDLIGCKISADVLVKDKDDGSPYNDIIRYYPLQDNNPILKDVPPEEPVPETPTEPPKETKPEPPKQEPEKAEKVNFDEI